MGKTEAQIDYASYDAVRMQTGSGVTVQGASVMGAATLLPTDCSLIASSVDRSVVQSAFLFHVNSCEILLPLSKHSRLVDR